jgi:hypothetical protein
VAVEPLELGPVKPGLIAVSEGAPEMKGKYAARAANRRAVAEVEQTEEVYRRNIVKLTRERDEARAERDRAREDWKKESRILRAQLAEGTSARVEALTRELNRVREDRDTFKRNVDQAQGRYKRALDRLFDHWESEHGMTRADAMDAVLSIMFGNETHLTMGNERKIAAAFGTDVMLMLRRHRESGKRVR